MTILFLSLFLFASVPELRTLLSAALERVNLDLVFEADPTEDAGNGGHSHTAPYLLLWLILIEIMSHCGPEVRAHVHLAGPQVPLAEFLLVEGGGGGRARGQSRNSLTRSSLLSQLLVDEFPLPLTIILKEH